MAIQIEAANAKVLEVRRSWEESEAMIGNREKILTKAEFKAYIGIFASGWEIWVLERRRKPMFKRRNYLQNEQIRANLNKENLVYKKL